MSLKNSSVDRWRSLCSKLPTQTMKNIGGEEGLMAYVSFSNRDPTWVASSDEF
jgi:hypothetical protein